jgi:SAM-dependent methyltransferase
MALARHRDLFESIIRGGDRSGAADQLAASRLLFALSRYDEGERSVALLGREFPRLMARPGLTVLDLGSGNGGMLFPFGERAGARLVALDVYLDRDLAAFRRAAGLPVLHLLGNGAALPLAPRSVDVVIMAEVIEHLAEPRQTASEIARVLRPGGVCLLSTPPRLKFARQRDPHYGIPGLALLPDPLQRFVAQRLYGHADYNVAHLYATSWGVARQFPPGAFRLRVLCPHRQNWTRHLAWAYLAFERT